MLIISGASVYHSPSMNKNLHNKPIQVKKPTHSLSI